jgi:hypothetical protein
MSRFNFDDYTEDRAVLAITGLIIITTLVAKHLIGDTAFASCFVAILGAYTTHSCLDDRRPGLDKEPTT